MVARAGDEFQPDLENRNLFKYRTTELGLDIILSLKWYPALFISSAPFIS
jgi:hypothetical protein